MMMMNNISGCGSFRLPASNNTTFKNEVDDYGTVVNPAEITGQSLAVKMETDKMDFSRSFDLEKFINDQADSITIPDQVEETQDLIQEMEDFLSQYEEKEIKDQEFENLADQLLNMEQQQTLDSMDSSCPVTNGDLTFEEIAAAENLIDELLLKKETEIANDSGFEDSSFNVSNYSENHGTNGYGNTIIIVIPENPGVAHENPGLTIENPGLTIENPGFTIENPELSGSNPEVVSNEITSDSDSDWVPEVETLKKKPGRKLSARQPVKTLKSGKIGKKSTIKDKKERKKIQNVMAARRYRDKKKLEAQEAENEEQTLMMKNRELKEQLKDIENEMKTMKKLMVELGLFKVVRK